MKNRLSLMMLPILTGGLLLMFLSNVEAAGGNATTVTLSMEFPPEYGGTIQRGEDISIHFKLQNETLASIIGFSGDILFDPTVFSNPVLESPEHPWILTNGILVEPGRVGADGKMEVSGWARFRFTLFSNSQRGYMDPLELYSSNHIAELKFHVDAGREITSPTDLSFDNLMMKAAKGANSPWEILFDGNGNPPVEYKHLENIGLHYARVKKWILYE